MTEGRNGYAEGTDEAEGELPTAIPYNPGRKEGGSAWNRTGRG